MEDSKTTVECPEETDARTEEAAQRRLLERILTEDPQDVSCGDYTDISPPSN